MLKRDPNEKKHRNDKEEEKKRVLGDEREISAILTFSHGDRSSIRYKQKQAL